MIKYTVSECSNSVFIKIEDWRKLRDFIRLGNFEKDFGNWNVICDLGDSTTKSEITFSTEQKIGLNSGPPYGVKRKEIIDMFNALMLD